MQYTGERQQDREAEMQTYVGAGGMLVGILVELPGSCTVHLDQCDTSLAPHLLWLVHRQKRIEDEAHQAPRHRPRVHFEANQNVLHGAYFPKLESKSGNMQKEIINSSYNLENC